MVYIQDRDTIQEDLRKAERDFSKSIGALIDKHAASRGNRPGLPKEEPAVSNGTT